MAARGKGTEMTARCNWAAILAGGDGTRLQEFTRLVAGDERPKQFCRLFGRQSLVNETRARLCLNVEPANTVCVVSKAHERFYRDELRDLPRRHIVEQPANRGTAAAIAAAVVRLRHLTDDCVVGFFPADHYYRDPCSLRRTIAATYAAAHAAPDRVFLIGAEPTGPEIEFGWIQPGDRMQMPRVSVTRRPPIRSVQAFYEKPSRATAIDLLQRRCLWNTFIVIGSIGAFEQILASAVPGLWEAFARLLPSANVADDAPLLDELYTSLPRIDFSHDVLAAVPERLGVVAMPAGGWTDLGQPSRVLDVLANRSGRGPRLGLAAS